MSDVEATQPEAEEEEFDVDHSSDSSASLEEENHDTIELLQSRLKRSRWNVFTFLGVALIMFAFALFPMPLDVDYELGIAEKDIGFVWGPSLSGEDFMDVPFEVTVKTPKLPTNSGNSTLEVYVLEADDCQDTSLSEAELTAKAGDSHEYQHGSISNPVQGETYTFDFRLDMARYCVSAKLVDDEGTVIDPSSTTLEVTGKLWPNQVIAGVPGLFFLGLSAFAFIGAQKIGSKIKSLLEDEKISEEQIVLEEARNQKIAQGPSGPPKPVAGPAGPPNPVAGPAGPPQTSVEQSAEPSPSAPAFENQALENNPIPENSDSGSVFEDAGNGYFYRKMADGSYEQTIYIQNESGEYVPYQA